MLFASLLSSWLTGAALAAPAPQAPALPGDKASIPWEVPCLKAPWPAGAPERPFPLDEKLAYAVDWLGFSAGKGEISLLGLDTVDRRPAYHARMELQATGLAAAFHSFQDTTDSWIDKASLTTVRAGKKTRESNFRRDEAVVLDQACRRFYQHDARLDQGTVEVLQGTLSAPTYDMLGYIYLLRTLPLAPDARFGLHLLSGGRVRPITFVVKGVEKVSVPAGSFDCFHLEPDLSAAGDEVQNVEVWLAADARRTPVRLRIQAPVGHFTVELSK